MNKTLISLAFGMAVLTSGCQSITNAQSISAGGITNMSCSQVKGIFDSYNADKTSLGGLTGLIGVAPSSVGTSISPAQVYNQARDAANVYLTVKGCGTQI
jgi:hypothetical protein